MLIFIWVCLVVIVVFGVRGRVLSGEVFCFLVVGAVLAIAVVAVHNAVLLLVCLCYLCWEIGVHITKFPACFLGEKGAGQLGRHIHHGCLWCCQQLGSRILPRQAQFVRRWLPPVFPLLLLGRVL